MNFKYIIFQKRKAQVFLMSSLILASVAALGLALVSVYLKNLRMVYQLSESTKAFYLADGCAEWRLYNKWQSREDDSEKPVFTIDNRKNLFYCEYDPNYELPENNQIKTVGFTPSVQRGINIYFEDEFFDF